MTDDVDADGVELYETVGQHERSDAMPGPIVDKIRSFDQPETDHRGVPVDGTWGDFMLPEMKLPGFDGNNHDYCGDPLPHICECCGSRVDVGQTCDESTCERCASSWCRKRATDWAARLMALKNYRYAVTDDDQYYHHLTISPPDGWGADVEEPRKAGSAIVRRIMNELGVEGVALYHPFRGKDEEPGDASHPVDAYDDDGPRADDDRGEWKKRLFSERSWEDVRDELKFSPHYHVVCTGGFVRGGQLTKAVEDATGWVIHRITPDDPEDKRSIPNDRALARVLAYVYSHTGIRETDAGNHRVESTMTGEHLTGEHRERFQVADDWHDRADQLVREEAWRVLGIPSAEMTCHEDLLQPPDDDDEEQVGAGDGDDDQEADGGERYDRCDGGLIAVNEYDEHEGERFWKLRLDDDDWRESARFAEEAERTFREWQADQQPDSPIWDVLTAG